jgi:patatin-related protein
VTATDWLPLPEGDRAAEEEVRLAIVLNGGVSLAVWMGGVVAEIDRLTRRVGVYGRILAAQSSRVRADVIAGTSAGGINGACLAVSQVHPDADVAGLREVWARKGSLYDLLQEPWKGEPSSLLQGDDVFLPALRSAFADLMPRGRAADVSSRLHSPDDRPVHLVLTTTLLNPIADVVTDALGTPVQQPRHGGRFTFLRLPRSLGTRDDFSAEQLGALGDRLAFASRCTASFPVAFEPVFVPVGGASGGDRPDMGLHADFPVSRWVVDGGVLMNTPIRPVLEAVARAPAGRQVRRVLLLVVPDPYVAPEEAQADDDAAAEPTVNETLRKIALAPAAQTVAAELRQIADHNVRATERRNARTDLLRSLPGADPAQLVGQAQRDFPQYRYVRVRRAARDIARCAADELARREDVLAEELHGLLSRRADLPFVPREFGAGSPPTAGPWPWGLATLDRLGAAVLDLLRRAMWVLPPDGRKESVAGLRDAYYEVDAQLRELRRQNLEYWERWAGSVGDESLEVALDRGLDRWAEAVLPDGAGALARELLSIADLCVGLLPPESDDREDVLGNDRLTPLRRVFGQPDPLRLTAALALEVVFVCRDDGPGSEAGENALELVHVSADVPQPFVGRDMTALDRVAGLRLAHFAAFLKQSWRANDWTWGRLDAANRLVTMLLDPLRLRRLVRLVEGPRPGGPAQPAATPTPTALRILGQILGDDAPDARRWRDVLAVLDGEIPHAEARPALQGLVDHLVVELANEIVTEEEPALRRAVEADLEARDNPDSAGARWLRRRYPDGGRAAEGEPGELR